LKSVLLLGGSGSIGRQTTQVLNGLRDEFLLVGISLSRDYDYNLSVLNEFKSIKFCHLREKSELKIYKNKFPNIKFFHSDSGLLKIISSSKFDIVINALPGFVGFLPTLKIINVGSKLLLANKESLVVGGEIVNSLLKEKNASITPIDSEHQGVYQLLKKKDKSEVDKIIITASGGALRDYKLDDLVNVKASDVLKHPNWNMGKYITIDSATMLNKVYEIIEAHFLFGFDYSKIEAFIERTSNIHALTLDYSGNMDSFSSSNDMKIMIFHALKDDQFSGNKIELKDYKLLNIDEKLYPLYSIRYSKLIENPLNRVCLVSANTISSRLFLENKISFLDLININLEYFNGYYKGKPNIRNICKLYYKVGKSINKKYNY
jgi:1-deoxy-D-xylulose-5-phosphate reductoisomerase